ncbi:hypothetical protein Har1130_05220 [Haloarcula sp. CBA1130]|uniref:DUF7289 family protein n=1 Tax=unclassified Haloarcula TaxID=2624677 RepID=UPI0012441AB3|nr:MULTISPECIES: CARDB domain-containing protein [unclassified Haloarcula]KAA9398145.1 hypothetical protein Har1129_07920 [Haloarcula sp. CBA1129]KAA9402168.1 hypothetical protein Har1130_05220 [Haloarcula sp. CBA1130]
MFEWGSRGAEDRGVSHVLGVVLLASAVIIGAVLIVQVGQQTIGDVNDDANVELAEEVLLSVDQSFQRSGTNESVEIPNRVRSDVAVSDEATYNLTLNGRSACSTGNRSLQTIRYHENGQQVGYQGGGVWRMTESGATMSSPPAVNYDQGALSVSFANISGQQIAGSSVSIRSNATAKRSHEAALQMALFTDVSYNDARTDSVSSPSYECTPSQVANATLTIENSSYARAWADWARSTYDDQYVEVSPSSVEPGETVHIRFALGDVTNPTFEVEDVTVKPDPSDSGKAVVTATVHNTGGLEDTQEITLKHNQSGSPSEVDETVTLAGGESTTASQSVSVSTAKPHNFTVESKQDRDFKIIEYTSVHGTPSLDITGNSIPATARLNQVPSAEATVTNTGQMTADQEVVFRVNGTKNATRSVLVDPGQSRTIDFGPSMPTAENGTYDLEVKTADDTYSQYSDDGHYFVVGDAGVFNIASVSPPGGLQSGDTATVEATVENTGDIRKSTDVEVRIENATSGSVVTSKNTTLTLNGARRGSESGTASVTSGPLVVGSPQHYTYVVDTPDDTESGSFVVGSSPPPLFEITAADVQNPVAPGNQTSVEFTVTNTGGTEGKQTLRVEYNGTTAIAEDERLDPGEGVTLDRTVTAPAEPGKYSVTFSTANRSRQSTLNVQPDSLLEGNGSTITIQQSVNASVALKGADLEGFSNYRNAIFHAPVQMSLYVDNGSDPQSIGLWRGYENGDVNGPYAEKRLVSDEHENPYYYSDSFEPGTEVSVFAKSYGCDRYADTSPSIELAGYDTMYCSNWDTYDTTTVSQTQNQQNLVILNDGDELPAFEQAQWYQRDIQDTLGSRVNDTGYLQLGDGERAFLYELSQENANPANAANDGDPDYNDAVVLFTVNAIEKDVQTGPEYKLIDTAAPSRVDETTDATLTAEVINVGGKSGEVTLESSFDGNSVGTNSTTIEPGETETVTFTLPTSSKSTGESYPYTVSVAGTQQKAGGNVRVGDTPEPFMQVDSVRGESVTDNDDTATATVNVTNVGGQAGTDTVVLRAENKDDATPSFTAIDSETMSTILSPGETRQFTLDMPTSRGNYTYYVETSNSTAPEQPFFVGESNVVVNDTQSVNIGAETYNTSELIERRGGAQRMTVEVRNNGTVGDEREVNLTIKNKSDGSTVFAGSKMVTAGTGDLTDTDPYPAWAGYDVDLDPGYYTYEVTVYDETASGTVADTATGEIYLKNVDETGATGNDSPVTVDSDTVTLGS